MISNFHFIRPIALLLLPIVVVVWRSWQRHSDPLRGWREQMDPSLLAALVTGRGWADRGPSLWLPGAWSIAAIAIAGPTFRLEPNPFAEDSAPLMILLKADTSMDRSDPAPSRIERARLKIADLAEARKGQALGLIAYAGSAHLVLPPTRDTAAVARMAAEISPQIMPLAGDHLDLAIAKAAEVLKTSGGSILVFADSFQGETRILQAKGQVVNFLAINSPDGPENDSLKAAARLLNGHVQPLAPDGTDIKNLTEMADDSPAARAGNAGDRWQESGWWLVPAVAVIFASSFRREISIEEVAA